MATAKAIQTQAGWEARALELAEARNLTGTASYVGECHIYGVWRPGPRLGCSLAQRAQRSRFLRRAGAGGWVHGLPLRGGSVRQPCSHAGAALHGERQRKLACQIADTGARLTRLIARSEQWSWWMKGGEW